MQITDILAQMGGLQSIARELGVSESQAASGAAALAPAIIGGFKKQARFKKMLPMLGMLIAGYMAKQGGAGAAAQTAPTGAGLGGLLGRLLKGGGAGSAGSTPGGVGGLAAMLDMNGDGNPLDDILRLAGKATG